MELKPYQQQVIQDLEHFLTYAQREQTPEAAFNNYWEDKLGMPYTPKPDGSFTGMKPYKENIPGAIHVAIKVPTAGGKTFIACNALKVINQHLTRGNPKAVVWLVPWSNLLQQTVNNLSNPDHPYRRKLNSLFGNRVEVYEKEQLIEGANFNPSSTTEQLNIFVFNFSSLRINPKKKDDRKVFQQNGALESFRHIVTNSGVALPGTDETALINVIRSLNPVVIVDESHNAESDLSVEMLQNLNPSLVLDLTATPKSNSNIISFVNALALKKENMVKLPVVLYNHHRKEEVITSALHLRRQLELIAQEEEKTTGRYINPIVLFQAQSNIKGKDNTTFQKIKEKLVKLKIPEEQIKIKTSGVDELKGIDLSAKSCKVKYIITVNALKEGWDCPNAYILASLADKSSAVEVEQILGRVLRQPYVVKHQNTLLNMSFVLAASSKFQESLKSIVKGLQESGFSDKDYYAENLAEEPDQSEKKQGNLFDVQEDPGKYEPKSDEEFELDEINFDPDEKVSPDALKVQNPLISQLTERAEREGAAFEQRINETDLDNDAIIHADIMKTTLKSYAIAAEFTEIAKRISLPQFFKKADGTHGSSFFEELNNEDEKLHNKSLLEGFKLLNCDSNITFDSISKDIYQFDLNKTTGAAQQGGFDNAAMKAALVKTILARPKESQISQLSGKVVSKLGQINPIPHQDLVKYVERIFENITDEQVSDLVNNDTLYVISIKAKVESLRKEYAIKRFKVLIDSDEIFVKPNFEFRPKITPRQVSSNTAKSLYEIEGKMNGTLELPMILEVTKLENVVFWHRNLERGKGFALNGPIADHYPDFIIYTKKGNIILLETKGDFLDNDDSQEKNKLGKIWAEKAGSDFKYFMVFESKKVENTYTVKSVIEVLRGL